MAASADDALRRAQERAQRLSDLKVAHTILERNLGFDIDEQQAPWMCVLSMPYSACLGHGGSCKIYVISVLHTMCFDTCSVFGG